MDKIQNEKYYVVEHMEEGLFEWQLSEYQQVQKYLKDGNISNFVISNSDDFRKNIGKESQKVEQNIETLLKTKTDKLKIFLPKTLASYIDENQDINISNEIKIPFQRVCLLDLRGDKDLEPADINQFDCFLFGGILGDHPPRDRSKPMRDKGYKMKRLGEVQMSTDTAILVTKLIIENQIKLEDIPFIYDPVFNKNQNSDDESVSLVGFKYVSDQLDLETMKIGNKQEECKPIINPKIGQDLIFRELDFSNWDLLQ